MIEEMMARTNEYISSFPKKERKAYGQFFTPVTTARYMVDLIQNQKEKVRLLDPGAGNGLLAGAVIEKLVLAGQIREIWADLYENDPHVHHLLQSNIAIMKDYCREHGVILHVRMINDNFITSNADYWKNKAAKGRYDIVICNPPYLKIGKCEAESQCMEEIVFGQPNLYFLFMAMSVKMLRKGGEFVFITPRSWTSGLYFKQFRGYFLKHMNLRFIHLFHSRNNAFNGGNMSGDAILQETMITYAVKSREQGREIILASCEDATSFAQTSRMCVRTECCLNHYGYILFPLGEEDLHVLDIMRSMPNSVAEAGYRFKTGQVVEFRNRDYLSKVETENAVPLLHSCNVLGGRIQFPAETDKSQYFLSSDESDKNIMENQNTVFLKRATAKEEPRRLQAALHIADNFAYPRFSAENHLNYLIKVGDEMSLCEVYGFYTILSSDIWERYYRMLNGSTQVNSEELNSMPIPAVSVLQHIGRMAMHFWREREDITMSSDDIIREVLA